MKTDWENRLAIHILTRERHEYLAVLLESLRQQTYNNWDLFILDNNDAPYNCRNVPLLVSMLTRIQYEKHNVNMILPISDIYKKNIGLSRNILIEASKEYKWAVRVDDDSILDRNYLEKLWKIVLSHHAIAVGGIVPTYQSPDIYKYPPKIFNQIKRTNVPERYLVLSKKYPELGGFTNETEEYYNVGEPIDDGAFRYHPNYLNIIPSHHLRSSYLFSLSAINEIGGFPSSDDTGFREETIASIKLLEKGYKLYTNTRAIAWHLWAPNLGRGYTSNTSTSKGYSPQDHEKKILKNEITFQRNYREIMRKLFK